MAEPGSFPNSELLRSESAVGLTERVDLLRTAALHGLDPTHRAELGQYPTPPQVARFMAAMFGAPPETVRLLDAGAGVGTLTAAFVEEMCQRTAKPLGIEAITYELDPALIDYLRLTLIGCQELCQKHQIEWLGEVHQSDFIIEAVTQLRQDLFAPRVHFFNRAILNPPYHKIRSDSQYRVALSQIGIETSNLYTGFLALVVALLEPGGELVAITPRSFCNGPYFKPFRKHFLDNMTLKHLHVFEARDRTFSDDEVLQENVIIHAVKNGERNQVVISRAYAVSDDTLTSHEVAYDQVIEHTDPDMVIHIVTDEMDAAVKDRARVFDQPLDAIGLNVSTGRVVDFRMRDYLGSSRNTSGAPLIHPGHIHQGFVQWPNPALKKPDTITLAPATEPLLVPAGWYVVVKRFSAKEESRRIVAAVFDPNRVRAEHIAFENHLNFYHINGSGMSPELAAGLTAFLNSTLIDVYFRQFSGHTQVNAADLRMLRYPDRAALKRLGTRTHGVTLTQAEIDMLLEEEIRHMTDPQSPDPIAAKQKIQDALQILKALGLPRGQLNNRSALTLLALLGLRPEMNWAEATNPRIGITPIMDFCRDHYGTKYAPNTRETFRRQTMHQFLEACLVVANPDQPDRPVNSPKWCYQIEPKALRLLKAYRTPGWESDLTEWTATVGSLKRRYAREREMNKVPLQLADGAELYLSAGSHSRLIRAVVEEFAPRFVPGGQVIYIGDTGEKWGYFDVATLEKLGAIVDEHGKMPDVVFYDEARNWLILVEAVTSHGPIDPKRRSELANLFKHAQPGLVFVTAFLTRANMTRYLSEISWETEVWVAESETHLIHFNGERFLGPHKQ